MLRRALLAVAFLVAASAVTHGQSSRVVVDQLGRSVDTAYADGLAEGVRLIASVLGTERPPALRVAA